MHSTLLLLTTLFFAFLNASNVIVGTTENFDSLIGDNEFVLVEFYAPWCGHCKNLEPEYEAAATTLVEQGSAIKLVKIDATVETSLGSQYDIKGYPTLKFFRSGVAIDYEGDRQAAGIVSWVLKKSGPASVELTAETAVTFAAEKPAVVGVFAKGSDDFEVFMSVAKAEDDFKFGHVFGEATTITLHTVDEGDKVYAGELNKDALKQWIRAEGFPLLQELDQNVWQRSAASQTSLFVAFVDPNEASQLELAQTIAKANKGVLTVTYMDSTANAQLAERWGASGNVFPTAVIISYAAEEPALFTWDEEADVAFTPENLGSFITESLAGTYKSYQKSEPIPESNDGPVTVVVGKTYEAIVKDTTKDVLIEFYAPWCGHCKKLAPIYEELGAKFAGIDSVVIAKIDATANSGFDDLDIKGFPTIYFFPAGEGSQPIVYEDARELDDFVKFIVANGASDFTLDAENHVDL